MLAWLLTRDVIYDVIDKSMHQVQVRGQFSDPFLRARSNWDKRITKFVSVTNLDLVIIFLYILLFKNHVNTELN